jgi:putative hydrolase of the HAD superfamily
LFARVKGILFDLDGTLFDRDTTVHALVEAQRAAFAPALAGVRATEFVARVLELDEHGFRDKTEVYATVVRELALPAGLAGELAEDFWHRYPRHSQPFFDTTSTLREVRRRGLKTGVITNGRAVIQNGTIDALDLRDLLDTIAISEVEGMRKPDQRIFARAVERLDLDPADCVFVGDHPEVDIAGARAAGLNAIWKRTLYWNPPVDPVPTIDALSGILRLV